MNVPRNFCFRYFVYLQLFSLNIIIHNDIINSSINDGVSRDYRGRVELPWKVNFINKRMYRVINLSNSVGLDRFDVYILNN